MLYWEILKKKEKKRKKKDSYKSGNLGKIVREYVIYFGMSKYTVESRLEGDR